MRFILDTNILIPLEDSTLPLAQSLASIVRLANEHGHQLSYHPASEEDIRNDTNECRRDATLCRLDQYSRLEENNQCVWNEADVGNNDAIDNRILYSLHLEAADALITEDRGIHDRARRRGLLDRVYTIQTAEDLLLRLHGCVSITLPNVEDIPLYSLTPLLDADFFSSLRAKYGGFDEWFRRKARANEKAWVAWKGQDEIGAICIYIIQTDERVTECGKCLEGRSLKLSTFKVSESVRGRKIGELFLKAAFRYATKNLLEHIFIHGDKDEHHFLFALLEDFGFEESGIHPGGNLDDVVSLVSSYKSLKINWLKTSIPSLVVLKSPSS